jgi:hypothetical protein
MDRRKVFGIGWSKTGTTTLGDALRILGFKHGRRHLLADGRGGRGLMARYANGDLDPLIDEASRYDSLDDWPWMLIYSELDEAFPGSRFVLTTRDPDAWLSSWRNMLEAQRSSPDEDERIGTLFGLPFPDVSDAELVERVARHNREVQDHFADRPGDLLVVDWTKGDGWPKLCSFLGVEEPDVPFPHANRGWYWVPQSLRRWVWWIEGYRRADWGRLGRLARRIRPGRKPAAPD